MSQIARRLGQDAAVKRALLGLALVACGNRNKGGPSDASAIDAQVFLDAPIDAPVLPAFRNPVALPDDELAMQALGILGALPGATTASCNTCHGMTKQHLRYWRALADTSMTKCLTDLQVQTQDSALQMINCLRSMPEVTTSSFDPVNLGIYATAARLPWFDYTFWKAYGADAPAQKAAFIEQAAMPHGSDVTPLTQPQFDIVAEWVARGQPLLDSLMPPDGAPTTCTPGISADVAAHTAQLATTGWRAVNRDAAMAMFDCGTATDPKQCMTHEPLAATTAYGATWDVAGRGTLRILDDVTYKSSYWTRSSPDGRFVAHGVRTTGKANITDLQRSVHIPVSALYDPGFFPDGSGFVFQGGAKNTCPISVLTSNPATIALTEPGCTKYTQIGLYQHVGKALGGGDYFTIDGEFVSDDGGHTTTLGDPAARFGANAKTYFNPFVMTGNAYVAGTQVEVAQPYEGDAVLSPSATLELTRIATSNDVQIGYVLHKVNAVGTTGNYAITTPEIARYCITGGKVGFSYDERWVVYHHYVTSSDADARELGFTGAADPGFAPYKMKGAANLYLMDLATGAPVRITNMAPGQYALMPHFRSDGWIYANVRDGAAGHEYFIASDAALQLE